MDRPAAPADGRNRRRARNVDVVVDAMLGLLGEGRAWPSAGEIAARAGLSERSVYRYFDDLDGLARAAVETQTARADHLFRPLEVPEGAGLDERIGLLAEHRTTMFDQVGRIVQAARARSSLHEPVAAALAHRRDQLRAQLEALFAAELAAVGDRAARDDVLAALEVVTGFEALQALRIDRRRSVAAARRILHRAVAALLSPAA